MTIPLPELSADLKEILEGALGNARDNLKDLLPDIEHVARKAAEYALKASMGDASAKECLDELRHQARLLGSIIAKRGENISAFRLEQSIDVLAKFLALLLKRMLV